MASAPSTGFQYAPVASDDIGRRFERDVIPTPLGVGFDASVADASQNGPASNVIAGAKMGLAELAGDAPTQKDLIKQRKDKQGQINDLLDRMPGGFISGTTAFAGQALGFAADPLNTASAIAAPELIGDRVGATANALAERATANTTIARSIAGAGTAAIEGGAIMAPGALTHLAISDPYQEDFNSLDAFSQIGVGAALGGVLGGAGSMFKAAAKAGAVGLKSVPAVMTNMIQPIVDRVGAGFGGTIKMGDEDVVKPFDQQSVREAQQTAAGQLAQGKNVNVGDQIKNAFNTAQGLEDEPQLDVSSGSPVESPSRPSLEKAEAVRKQSIENATTANEEFQTAQDDFKKTLKETPKKAQGPIEALDTENVIDRLGSISQKIRESGFGDVNNYEKEFIGRNARTPDLDKVRRILGGDPMKFTQDDADFINEVIKNEEPRLREQQEKTTNDVAKLKQQLKTTGTKDLKLRLKDQLKPKEDLLKRIQRRVDAIEDVKKKAPTPVEDAMKAADEANLKRLKADKDLKDAMVAQMVLETPHQPITTADVRATGEDMMTPASDMEPPTDEEAFPGHEKQDPDEVGLLKEDEDLYNQLKDAGELTDDEIDAFNAVQEELDNQEGYTKMIKQTAQCLRGSL